MEQNEPTEISQDSRVWVQGFEAEQAKAVNRILEMHDGAIGWLLNFVSINLDSLGAGGWQDLRHELSAFAALGHRMLKVKDGLRLVLQKNRPWERGWQPASELIGKTLNLDRPVEEMLEPRALPSPQKIQSLQKFCQARLDTFTTDGRILIRFPEGGFTVITTSDTWITTNSGEGAFIGHFTEILKSERSHLKRCKECETFFLGYRKDKLFCSVRCLGRDKIRRYRKTQSEKSATTKKQIPKKARNTSTAKRKPTK